MPRCYFLPGFLGSQLRFFGPDPTLVWINYNLFAVGGLEFMRLDTDGLSPANPNQLGLIPGPPLPDEYGPTIQALRVDPSLEAYEIVPLGWDWRKDLALTGLSLALEIIGDGKSRDSPCTIVGHSAGGLVARLAWWYLGRFNCQAYCRRIVTLGTPHYGTWTAVQMLLGIEPTLRQIAQFERNVTLRFWSPLPETVPGTWIQSYLAGLFATFPSVYQLMPFVDGPEFEQDPARGQYFDPAAYADLGWVKAKWLASAREDFQPLMKSANTRPPKQVLRCVAGQDLTTAQFTRHVASGQLIRGSWTPGSGDSIVTELEAVLDGWPSYLSGSSHKDMPFALAGTGVLAKLILDNSIPPDPPPPVELPVEPGQTDPGLLRLLLPIRGHEALDC